MVDEEDVVLTSFC